MFVMVTVLERNNFCAPTAVSLSVFDPILSSRVDRHFLPHELLP